MSTASYFIYGHGQSYYPTLLITIITIDSVEKRPSMKLIFVGHDVVNLPFCLTEKKIQDKGE